jgi:hypothetical protein
MIGCIDYADGHHLTFPTAQFASVSRPAPLRGSLEKRKRATWEAAVASSSPSRR